MEERSEYLHSFYASLVCAAAKVRDSRIEQAFRAVKREPFVGPGPWLITLGGHAYVQTPNDDPAFKERGRYSKHKREHARMLERD